MTVDGYRWIATAAPLATRYDDMCFVSEERGWAVNSHGQILATDDGGRSWREQALFPDVYLRTITMADERVGWAGSTTPEARLFHTRDGGASWKRVTNLPADGPAAICGMWAVGTERVFAAGTNYPDTPTRFLASSDGGTTWTMRAMDDLATLLVDVFFRDEREGWVVGGRALRPNPTRADVSPVVLHTIDGGRSFRDALCDSELDLPAGEWGWKIHFVDDRFGVVACENFEVGAILITEDGGETWRRQEIRDSEGQLINANLEGVGFLDRQTGWVGGWGDRRFESGRTSVTVDGGRTWRDVTGEWPQPITGRPCEHGPDGQRRIRGQYLNRFCFPGDAGTVYAAGNVIYKLTADTSEPERPEDEPEVGTIAGLIDSLTMTDDGADITIVVPPRTRELSVRIYGRFAELVRVAIADKDPAPGPRVVHWNLHNDSGEKVSAGQYVVRICADERVDSRLLSPSRFASGPGAIVLPHLVRRS